MSAPSDERKPLTDTLQERLDHIDRYFRRERRGVLGGGEVGRVRHGARA